MRNVDDMPAGREMDELIDKLVANGRHCRAEHKHFKDRFVFKWAPMENWSDWVKEQFEQGNYGEWKFCGPAYSVDIAAAWRVVEGVGLSISPAGLGKNGKPCYWYAGLPYIKESGEQIGIRDASNPTMGHAETAPLTICRAALKVVGAGT